jgi:glycosyltransferase involved in cell wall biosynthesis
MKGVDPGETEAKPRPLDIGVITETYPPEINGVANTLLHLVEGLEHRGHRIQLVRPRQLADRPSDPQGGRAEVLVPGVPIPGYRGLRFGLPVYWRLRRLWRQARVDVAYIATQGPLGHAALSAARALAIPTLTGFHTQFHQYSSHYGLGLLKRPIIDALRRFHNRSDTTLIPSSALAEELTALGFRNLHLLGRGVDTELFDPRRRSEDLRRSWGCGPTGPAVLYVGRLAAEKNLELILRAFRDISVDIPDARLVLVGDGPERAPLQQTRPDVVLTGAKVGTELAEHYASGDLFLFPSLTETFGNVVLEAMASGLPVIAFDYAAAHSCIHNQKNGIRVPTGNAEAFIDAAVTAIQDAEGLRVMSQGARATAERMSWERVVCDLEQRILEVIRMRRDHPNENLAAAPE